jgi:two-component sensor histidine kinase
VTATGDPSPHPADGPQELDVSSIRLLELRHRIKNLLAIVQAVAHQTLRTGRSIEEARGALDGRLVAMGHAVDMLLQTGWTAGGLRDVIARALLDADGRVSAEGADLVLNPDAVMALTLVFHELESNSLKYGALSVDGGRVAVRWSAREEEGVDCLRLEWVESGGPPCAPPSRKGFGSQMVAKLVGGRLRGRVGADYGAEGLSWHLAAPMAAMVA